MGPDFHHWWEHREYAPPSPPPNTFSAPMLIPNPNNPGELMVTRRAVSSP